MIRSFTIKHPFPESLMRGTLYPLRIVFVPDSAAVLARYNMNKGAKADYKITAYYCHAKYLHNNPGVIEGELCFSAFAFDPGVIAHESYHAVIDARRSNRLHREANGWEETIAHSLQWLTGIIWRRGDPIAWRVRHAARVARESKARARLDPRA